MNAAEKRDEWRHVNRHREWARLTISAHRRKGYLVTFTREWLTEKAKSTITCPLCDAVLNFNKKKSRCPESESPSLDRTDREPIMTEDNVVIMCYACNTGKGVGTTEEYIARCKRIAKKYGDDYK